MATASSIEQIDAHRCFGGQQLRFQHRSQVLDCAMTFSVFLPSRVQIETEQAEAEQVETEQAEKVPVIYWLSGLTCTDENFVTKAGAQQFAEAEGVALVAPDTSPRGEGVPDDPNGAYDFGLGAGFYVDATAAPWHSHYRMYSYVVDELPGLLTDLPVDTGRASIMGHSMGGHGALTIALKNPEKYRSVSAFAPICSPLQCPWGEKALSRYLGDNREDWKAFDACELLKVAQQHLPILVDQGQDDNFLSEQLKPELLLAAAEQAGYDLQLRMQPGYDHSYFFIASFIGEHIRFHRQYL